MSSNTVPIPVSIAKCPDYVPDRVRAALRQCLDPLGGMTAFVSSGNRVLLKPNLLMGKPPESGVCTHPVIVRAVAEEIMEAGGIPFLGDSPAVESLHGALRRSGIMAEVKALDIQMVSFRTPVKVPVPEEGVYRSVFVANEALGFDLIVNLPRFKTHGMMTLTLAVKNMFGTVVGVAKSGWHLQTADQACFADLLLDIWNALSPGLNILDGITAMEGNGPGSGDPLDLGLILASPSALALDQIAGEIAGVPLKKHPVLYRALVRGMEGSEPGHVRVTGADIGEVARKFVLPSSVSKVDYKLPGWLSRGLKRSLNTYPEMNQIKCTSCGQCAVICPADAITLRTRSQGGGMVNKDKCINCYCCQEVCPEGAIDLVSGRLLRLLKKIGLG